MMLRFHEEDASGRVLAYVTGMVNRQLLLQNEYLIAENWVCQLDLALL